jgi:hypothetical protein
MTPEELEAERAAFRERRARAFREARERADRVPDRRKEWAAEVARRRHKRLEEPADPVAEPGPDADL